MYTRLLEGAHGVLFVGGGGVIGDDLGTLRRVNRKCAIVMFALAGCQRPATDLTALVEVKTKAGLKAKCIQVTASSAGGATVSGNQAVKASQSSYRFEIRLGALDSASTQVQAVGFGDENCRSGQESMEQSRVESLAFSASPAAPAVTLELGAQLPGDAASADASVVVDAGPQDRPDVDAGVVDSGVGVSDAGAEPPDLSNFPLSVLSAADQTLELKFENDCTIFDTSPDGDNKKACQKLKQGAVVTMSDGQEAWVYRAKVISVAVGAKLRFVGTRPVAFLASEQIEVDGSISLKGSPDSLDPRKQSEVIPGAGAKTNCAGNGTGANGSASFGGGAGGSHATLGGMGGNGQPLGLPAVTGVGGMAKPAHGTERVVPLVGGCNGGSAGPSTGGAGGGAIQLYAVKSVSIRGTIDAPGFGGDAGDKQDSTGGGGGGAGGAILVQTAELKFSSSATLTANAGSGGSGSFGTDLQAGKRGEDGAVSTTPAPGAPTVGKGGAGGRGGAFGGDPVKGEDGQDNSMFGRQAFGNGGGGGGSVGRIRIEAAKCTGLAQFFSPTPSRRYVGGLADCQ